MKWILAWYLMAGMVLCGFALAERDKRCPKDPSVKSAEILATVLIWPTAIIAAVNSDRKPECKVLP